MKKSWYFILLILFLGFPALGQPVMPVKTEARISIDRKRMVADINSNDAIYRSREFIREDPTYYVGWMFEGAYKYNHAADLLGYKNAIPPLIKALNFLSRDYGKYLRTRTNDIMLYYPAYQFQLDYTYIAALLFECYSNINQPQNAFEILTNAKKWRFQRNYYLPIYSNMAWVVHRNRYYTKEKYHFLENTIAENETLANNYLDSGLSLVRKNAALNQGIFQPGYQNGERLTIYHYKAILYSYQLNIDSAAYYYQQLIKGQAVSYNNYATFLSICGNFKEAMDNYKIAASRDGGDKMLREWAYFSSILEIYRNRPQTATKNLEDLIMAVGSTPGYGWYNIALARAESYNGQLKQSERHALKATQFKELNIGTTLGESQYNFSANLINLVNDKKRVQQQKFEHRNWWYNPFIWPKLSSLSGKRYLQHYLLVNQLALNPERNDVIYPLFSSENTVSWDEIWYLIEDFSTSYFYRIYAQRFQNDTRPLVKKYYLLFMAKLQIEQGEYKAAGEKLLQILQYKNLDPEFDRLLLARTYEALSICEQKEGLTQSAGAHLYLFYKEYPQLVPFSEVIMNFRLNIAGAADQTLISGLKAYRIQWNKSGKFIPTVNLSFNAHGNKKSVTYSVTGADGTVLIPTKTYYYNDSGTAVRDIAYGLFQIDLNPTGKNSEGQEV